MSFTESDEIAWSNLVEVDRLTVLAIVDNESDGLSSPCLACDPGRPGWTGAVRYCSEFSALTQVMDLYEIHCKHVIMHSPTASDPLQWGSGLPCT